MTTLSEHIYRMMTMTVDDYPGITASAVLYLLERAEREDKAIDAKYGMHVDGNNDEYMRVLKMAEDAGVADDIRRKEAIRVLEWCKDSILTKTDKYARVELKLALTRLKNGGTL